MGELAALGVTLFTDDGTGVQDAGVMRRALEYARGLGVTLGQHCEDDALAAGGHMHEGAWSSRLGVPGIPAAAEELMVARDIMLARLTGGRVHFLHLSTAGSVALVAAAKAEGLAVTAEVAPHHLALTDAELAGYDPVFKVNPPLRTDDRRGRAARRVRGGDRRRRGHRSRPPPVRRPRRAPSTWPPRACSGWRRPWPVTLGGAGRGHEASVDVVALLSWRPARIAGLAVDQGGDQGGPVAVGMPANLCVIDPSRTLGGRSRPAGQPQPQHALGGPDPHRQGPPHRLPGGAGGRGRRGAAMSTGSCPDTRGSRTAAPGAARPGRRRGVRGRGHRCGRRPAAWPPGSWSSTPCCRATRR